MCGFAGFWDPSAAWPGERLAATGRIMADTLLHRGPDDSGVWVDEQAGIALGHRRLSIVDLSAEGHQPMLSSDRRYVVAYNGEIYNFAELRRELEGMGHRFRGHSDTEVLLAAVVQWGIAGAVERFVGMFAFALFDRQERCLHLVRDRMGEKPLYFGWAGSILLFGSELKALRAHPAWTGSIDRDALTLFMRYNYVPAPYSIYAGIRKLLPGTIVQIGPTSAGTLPEPTSYWSLREVVERSLSSGFELSEAEAIESLDRLLRTAIERQMVADVPLGAFLSGGIDSSTVVALMQALSASPVRTFSIGLFEPGYNEAEHAKAVAAHLQTDHTELYVTSAEAAAVIPHLPSLYDEPFADSSQIPTFLVSSMARRQVTVSLSGDGGDELFGGYNRYFRGRQIWNRIGWVPRPVRGAAAHLLRTVRPGAWDSIAHRVPGLPPHLGDKLKKLADVLDSSDPDAVYRALVSNWQQPGDVVPAGREPSIVVTDPKRWPRLEDFTERMMFLDAVSYLPDDILVKVDRAAMGVSLETRVPFLDHRVVEFAWRVPLGMKVRDGEGKWLLRQVLYRYVPRELIERPKMGFGVPISAWLRGPLREWAEALLSEDRLRAEGYLAVEPIRRTWSQHLRGTHDWGYPLWSVLTFQAWLEEANAPLRHATPAAPVARGRAAIA